MLQTPAREFVVPFQSLKGGLYAIGERGAGKTTFLNNLVLSIVNNPRLFGQASIICLDAHGDQTFELLRSLPDLKHVRVFDPYAAPFSLNMLQLPPARGLMHRERLIEYLVGSQSEAFAQALSLSPARAPRAMAVCRAEIQSLVASRDDASWLDVYQLNRSIMRGDSYESIVRRFHLNRQSADSISTITEKAATLSDTLFAIHYRLDSLVRSEILSKTFCARRSNVDFREIIQPMHVSIFRFSSMEIPTHVQSIAFANIVVNLWCAALERASFIPEAKNRSPILLIIDEFQILGQLTVLEIILAQLRKVGLHPILSHQNLTQLNDKLIMSVLGNTAVQVAFSTSTEDARRLAQNLDPYRAQELTWCIAGLPRYQAICRVKWGPRECTPIRIICLPPSTTERSMEEVRRYLETVRQQRLSAMDEIERRDLPKWTEFYSVHEFPPPSVWPIVLALTEFDKNRKAATLTALSTSSLSYIPRNKHYLTELLEKGAALSLIEATRIGERTVYRLSGSARQVLFAYRTSGAEAKAGLAEHRAIKSAVELRYARLMYCPLHIEESEAREDPDGVLLRASEEADTWDIWRGTALEVEIWPEKHPGRVKWHVINDLNNLNFDRVLFVVGDRGKREWLLSFLRGNCRGYLDRINVEVEELEAPSSGT
jgi:hypothetical protein